MNYYLVECENPSERLRHYKNTRVAFYTRDQLNDVAGYERYTVISDTDQVHTISTRRTSFSVNPLAPGEQVFERLS
jgi:hypothetical protein